MTREAARDGGALRSRWAIEALRNGVPNRFAVEMLGCKQPRTVEKFDHLLGEAANGGARAGMLVSGEFGAGKSHLLAHLACRALAEGFVCSTVAISKETPLYDLGKVFAAAVENARMPDRQGRLMEELAGEADRGSEGSARLFGWAERAVADKTLNAIFPASLLVYESAGGMTGDRELNGRIESFWAGGRIRVGEVRDGLRRIGRKDACAFRAPRAAELPPQRLRFATELIRRRYRGWVVLLDEIELVGSYSLLQRGRSYAEVARWMGRDKNSPCPGLIAVGAVVDDFASRVISPDGDKKDRDCVLPRLATSRHASLGPLARTGMRLLEKDRWALRGRPGQDEVDAAVEKLREIYTSAYGWKAPRLAIEAGGAQERARMRSKVKAAINRWDLLRLYPDSTPDTVVDDFHHSYREDADLERAGRDDGADAGGAATATPRGRQPWRWLVRE